MSLTASPQATARRPSRRQRAGLVLAGVFCAGQIPSILAPTPEGEVGPPLAVLVACTVLGAAGLVAAVVAWRGLRRGALRVLAASMVLIDVSALPALFVDVPAWTKSLVAASLVWTLVALVLVFSGEEER